MRSLMKLGNIFLALALTTVLTACGGGGGPPIIVGADTTTVSGSAGDGPIIGGAVSVKDANGAAVATTPANPTTGTDAQFSFTVPSVTALPLTIAITGGMDTVTGAAQDFDLITTVPTSLPGGGSVTANANPLSTLAVASAKAKGGGTLTAANLAAATANVLGAVGFGLAVGTDPISTPVTNDNIANIVKANEAAAEMIRRVSKESGNMLADTIESIGQDLTDGVVDGKASAGATATKLSDTNAAQILTQQAKVSAELLANNLTVTTPAGATIATASGANFTSTLNSSITATGKSGDVTIEAPTQEFLDQTREAIAIANTLTGGGNVALNDLIGGINTLTAGSQPTTAQLADLAGLITNAGASFNTATTGATDPTTAGNATATTSNDAADTTAPPAPVITAPTTGATTGATPTVSGTAELNALVTVLDGSAFVGTVRADGAGAWMLTASTLTNGAHTLTAVATDSAGNTSSPSTAVAVTVVADVTAPTITGHNPVVNATNVALNAAIDATFSEPMDTATITTTSFTVTPAGGSAIAGTVNHNAGNNESFSPASNLSASATYTVALAGTITDVAGNGLTPTSWSFTTKPPPVWAQEAYIKAANAEANDFFGSSVSISADTLAVGATQEDSNQTTIINGTTASADNSANAAGAVYVYKRAGTNWAQEAYIKAANAGGSDSFGDSVSISADTLAVGASLENSNQTTITNGATASADNSRANAGAVYVYKRDPAGNTWAQEAYIKAANADRGDNFGSSVSISADTLAVGAKGEASNQTTITNGTAASANNAASVAGAVYVYKRDPANNTWAQEAYIKAANADMFDEFGISVSISADTLAVVAIFESSSQTTITNGTTASADNSASGAGAVYVYKREPANNTWAQEAYIKAANADTFDQFGTSVSIFTDTLAVGVANEDSNQTTITNGTAASADNSAGSAGAVYVYKRNPANNTWAQEAYIKAANADANDQFGTSVSISADTLAVGVANEDSNQTTITNGTTASADNSASRAGAVYVYKLQ